MNDVDNKNYAIAYLCRDAVKRITDWLESKKEAGEKVDSYIDRVIRMTNLGIEYFESK